MERINAVIIDDEKKNIDHLQYYIKEYCPLVEVIGHATTKRDAVAMINDLKPRIVFLDIILDVGTGFDVLKAVSLDNIKVIFVTAFDNFALNAFEYNAVDYVVKPIKTERLIIAVNRAVDDVQKERYTCKEHVEQLSQSMKARDRLNFLAIPSIDRIDFIDPHDIVYLESNKRYTIFHLQDGNQNVASRNMGEYEELLDPNVFFRIHKSYIVNLKFISSIQKTGGYYCVLGTNTSLPIAKRRQKKLQNFLKID